MQYNSTETNLGIIIMVFFFICNNSSLAWLVSTWGSKLWTWSTFCPIFWRPRRPNFCGRGSITWLLSLNCLYFWTFWFLVLTIGLAIQPLTFELDKVPFSVLWMQGWPWPPEFWPLVWLLDWEVNSFVEPNLESEWFCLDFVPDPDEWKMNSIHFATFTFLKSDFLTCNKWNKLLLTKFSLMKLKNVIEKF